MLAIESIRKNASIMSLGLIWVTLLLIGARAIYGTEANIYLLVGGALAVALMSTLAWRASATGTATRFIFGMNQAICVALLVYGFSGSPIQIDMHMYFFAALGITAAWIDWRPILAFTAVTAVHHLAFYFFLPVAVFPGESEFTRVILHAAILLMEAFALLYISRIVNTAFDQNEKAVSAANDAKEEAAALTERNSEAERVAATEKDKRDAQQRQHVETINGVVDTLADALNKLSNGDLSVRINAMFDDEFERLRGDFNKSAETLSAMISDLQGTSGVLNAHSAEITEATVALANRTEMQATASDEAMGVLQDLSGNIDNLKNTSENMKQVAASAQSSSEDSGKVVQDAVDAMSRIEKASGEISSVLTVIDEIAFQTNLLALNAGVEAARAGDAGAGFAVVAQEVRALAQRSADAAKEIKELIQKSEVEVSHGVKIVEGTGQSLNQIAGEILKIIEQITSMTNVSDQQVSSVRELNQLMADINSGIQRNAAMAEETGSASSQMSEAVGELSRAVAAFELEEQHAVTERAA